MKLILTVILLGLSLISFNAAAVDEISKKKYPYELLTDDYGVLDENDLAFYTWNFITVAPFSEEATGRNYWQCFPASGVSFDYKDGWYSDNVKKKVYSFMLNVKNDKGEIHKYMYKQPIPKNDCQYLETAWKKLMKGEQYVCLGGNFLSHEEEFIQGKKTQVFYWEFDKIKTKKGCESYFWYGDRSQCGLTYDEYKRIHEKNEY